MTAATAMGTAEKVEFLIARLLDEMPRYRDEARAFSGRDGRRRLLRSLMNVRPPAPLDPAFVEVQDALLSEEREARGTVHVADLPACPLDPRIALWRGDIVRLDANAVVNAANDALLGCFVPCHGCIDNAIHSAAGLQLREACAQIMEAQGHAEPTGRAKLTPAFNLPARCVLHTVGPVVRDGRPGRRDRELLASCYRSCLELAWSQGLRSVAFCCISTGEFGYPNLPAARVAVETVRAVLDELCPPGGAPAAGPSDDVPATMKVVFDVFKETDERIYRDLLGFEG